jgi:hypothetical protein
VLELETERADRTCPKAAHYAAMASGTSGKRMASLVPRRTSQGAGGAVPRAPCTPATRPTSCRATTRTRCALSARAGLAAPAAAHRRGPACGRPRRPPSIPSPKQRRAELMSCTTLIRCLIAWLVANRGSCKTVTSGRNRGTGDHD